MNCKLTILSPTLAEENVIINHIEWFLSLNRFDMQLIIVDQSACISSVAKNYSLLNDNFVYVHSSELGLSKNRNIGLDYVTGDFTVFFDDNSRFFVDIDYLIGFIDGNPYDAFCGSVVDNFGNIQSYTKLENPTALDVFNIDKCCNSNSLFIRSSLLKEFRFDILMGVGAFYGSCEELDLCYRLLNSKYSFFFNPEISVIHPAPIYSLGKSFSYGKGHGYLTRKLFKTLSISMVFVASIKFFKCIAKAMFFLKASNRYWVRGFVVGMFL